mmetsp:Transcript_23600/g.20961  ORF Transcript_23600/g.20961 Transcript_23600/m.20961 type:complete len:83 (+) Transcript_23600:807-1055(+)
MDYKKKRFQNSFHIMIDKIDKEEKKESIEEDIFSEPAPIPKAHQGHSSSITSFGMLYQQDNYGEAHQYVISGSTDSTIKIWK